MLKHLSVTRMLDLATPWITVPAAKAVFLSIPEIAPLYPKLADIHAELSRMRPGALTPPPVLQQLRADVTALDVQHDALARAVFSGLQAERAYALAADPPALADARRIELAIATLFPKGLRVVNVSVLAEAGHALIVRTQLARSPRLRALLESIPVRGRGTLLGLTERWLATAERLGHLEHDLRAREAVHARKRVTKAEMNAARGRFIRLVSLVLGNLALSDAPQQAIETIRHPLLTASKAPKRRPTTPKPSTTKPTTPKPSRAPRPRPRPR